MKKCMLLILVWSSYLGAMNNQQSQTAAEMYAKAKELNAQSLARINGAQERLKNPDFEPRTRELATRQLEEYQEKHTKSQELFAQLIPICFSKSISEADQTTVDIIVTDFRAVLWQKPSSSSGSWIDVAIRHAAEVSKTDLSRAHLYDEMAIYLFNQIKRVASEADNYGQVLATLLQHTNPLLEACRCKRKMVVQKLVPEINIEWRGSQDTQSPLEWAQQTRSLQQGFESSGIHTTISLEEMHCAQPILDAFSYAQLQKLVANNQAMWDASQAELQTLAAQAKQQRLQWQQLQIQAAANERVHTQSHTRSKELSSGTPVWKKVVVFAVAAYAFKKLYDWYCQKPTDQPLEGENTDDEFVMVDENFDTHR